MSTYRIVTATVTLPIIGTVSRGENGNITKQAEFYRVHIKAVSPGEDKDSHIVGVLSGSGYTTEPFKKSFKVILPEGYDLIAQLVDDAGIPIPQETLPIATGGGEGQSDSGPSVGNATIQNGSVRGSVYPLGVGIKKEDKPARWREMREMVNKVITERLAVETRPGGMLYRL